jgi:F0F1-type ATP synthase gamma subunit
MDEQRKSEVARIKEQIALEYQAANHIFINFTPTAKHAFITKRTENIARYFEELKQIVPTEEAFEVVLQIQDHVTSSVSSGNTS